MDIHTPDWVKHACFYQIFPDRFARSTQPLPHNLQPGNLESWESLPTTQGYKGGNLWGIFEQLDYIQSLGINAIYLNPIFQSACNHRYHTHDYYQVDPLLGGNVAFRALLDAAHQRGIKIVLDGVFNHASRGFFFFNDILENGQHSPWIDWFKIEDFPLRPYDEHAPANYASWLNLRALPQFNHEHPAVREYLMQVAEHWIRFGIDGWRLDVPECIQAENFWQEFRNRVKAINPEAYLVGEIFVEAQQWLDGTQFDGVMNYLFRVPTIMFAANNQVFPAFLKDQFGNTPSPMDAQDYAKRIHRLLDIYDWEIQQTQLNLLSSHDTARLSNTVLGDHDSICLAILLLMTFPGAPCMYYGDEVGLSGGHDPECRKTFPPESRWEKDILECTRNLIALRHAHPALRTGAYKILWALGSVYVFARLLDEEELVVAVNVSPEATEITMPSFVEHADQRYAYALKHQPLTVLYGTGKGRWECVEESHMLNISLPPRSGTILGTLG